MNEQNNVYVDAGGESMPDYLIEENYVNVDGENFLPSYLVDQTYVDDKMVKPDEQQPVTTTPIEPGDLPTEFTPPEPTTTANSAINWVKANPLMAIIAATGVYFLLFNKKRK